jgi:transposase-like protein
MPDFLKPYGTETQCEEALAQMRWPRGFRCSRCGGEPHGLVYGRRLKRYQCRQCGHQATVTADTIMEATKLPLTIWFLGFYLICQARTSISSLQLSRQLGVAHNTAWMLHSKILRAMSERDECYVLQGKVQMNDAYFGGERPGGKTGRGSENKVPIVAAISLNAAGHQIYAKISPVPGFTSEAIADWARQNLSSNCSVLSDGLACFRSVVAAGCRQTAAVTDGRHPNELPQFRWVTILLGNRKTSFTGTFHAFNFEKYAKRYLGGFCFRFNRHFKIAAMTERIANAICVCKPCLDRALKGAELYA